MIMKVCEARIVFTQADVGTLRDYSTCNRNEYQNIFLGVKRDQRVRLTT
jgi:hypothetical protein